MERPWESVSRQNLRQLQTLEEASYPAMAWEPFMNEATQEQISRWAAEGGVIQNKNLERLKTAQLELDEVSQKVRAAQGKGMTEMRRLGLDPNDWKRYWFEAYRETDPSVAKRFADLLTRQNALQKEVGYLAGSGLNTIERNQNNFRDRAIARGLITGIRPPHLGLFSEQIDEPTGGLDLDFNQQEFNRDNYRQVLTPDQKEAARLQYNRALSEILGAEAYPQSGYADPITTYARAKELYQQQGKEFPNLYRIGGSETSRAFYPNFDNEAVIRIAYPGWQEDYRSVGYNVKKAPTNYEARLYSPETALLTQLNVYQPGVDIFPYQGEDGRVRNAPEWSLYRVNDFSPALAKQRGLAVREHRWTPMGDPGSFYGGYFSTDAKGNALMAPTTKADAVRDGRYRPYRFAKELPVIADAPQDFRFVESADDVLDQFIYGDRSIGKGSKSYDTFSTGEVAAAGRVAGKPSATDQRPIASSTRTQLSELPLADDIDRVWGLVSEPDFNPGSSFTPRPAQPLVEGQDPLSLALTQRLGQRTYDDAIYHGTAGFGQLQNQAMTASRTPEGQRILSNYGRRTDKGFSAFPAVQGNRWLDADSTEALIMSQYGQPYQRQVRHFTPHSFTTKGSEIVQKDTQPVLLDVDTGDYVGHRWGSRFFARQEPSGAVVKEQRYGWIPVRRLNPATQAPSASFAGFHTPALYSDTAQVQSRIARLQNLPDQITQPWTTQDVVFNQTGSTGHANVGRLPNAANPTVISNPWKEQVIADLQATPVPLWEQPISEYVTLPHEDLRIRGNRNTSQRLNRTLREAPYTLAVQASDVPAARVNKPRLDIFAVPDEGSAPIGDFAWMSNSLAAEAQPTYRPARYGNRNRIVGVMPDWSDLTPAQRVINNNFSEWMDREIAESLYAQQQEALAEEGRIASTQQRRVKEQMERQSPTFRSLDWEQQEPKIQEHIRQHGGPIIDQRKSPLLNAKVAAQVLNPSVNLDPVRFVTGENGGDEYFWEDLLADQLEGKRLTEATPDIDWINGEPIALAPGTKPANPTFDVNIPPPPRGTKLLHHKDIGSLLQLYSGNKTGSVVRLKPQFLRR